MMQDTKRASAPTRPLEEETSEDQSQSSLSEKGEKLKRELDELLDEVDDVLEENAEDFVKSYVQRGGQ
jgi:ubiquitin-like protein Pup